MNTPLWERHLRKPSSDSEATLAGDNPKMAKSKLTDVVLTPQASSSINEADKEGSAEEEIFTAGARATLNNSQPACRAPRPTVYYEGHQEPGDGDSSEEESEEEPSIEDAKPRHVGFPPIEELPDWFPENIKQMYRVDRHGGSLSYKELNEITRYRAALEIIYRRKWRKYIKAGRARWQLQQALHHLKCRPLTKAFYKYREGQFRTWKEKGLRLWKRLEKTHRGILILEGTININFRQERIIYEKKLGRGHM